MRFTYLREMLPQLPATLDLAGIKSYLQQLSAALAEGQRASLRAFAEVDNPPVFLGVLGPAQVLTANTLTTVTLGPTIDTQGWFSTSTFTYTPKEAGFYRCSWAANFNDSGAAFATSTYALASVGGNEVVQYGNGAAQTIDIGGSTIIECDGATTGIKLSAFILAGTAPALNPGSRTWLAVNYLGKRAL